MAGNGTGSEIEGDVFKKIYGEVYAKFFKQKLIVDLYGDFERSQLSPYRIDKSTYKVFLAYQGEKITIGAEGYYQLVDAFSNYQYDVTHYGSALFSKITFWKDKFVLILRKDFYMYNPWLSTLYRNSEDFFLAGIDYMPNKNVHILPNVWFNSYFTENPALPVKERRDNDLVARITFYYIFK